MPAVQRLPDTLVNQIAAGEVVERPASVVKELCENGIDAGARRIEVIIEEGGTRLIEVQDDGCGMAEGDARLALERHATSKLRDEADLSRIATLGFRGEALPAIASVSHFTLTTRTADAAEATRLTVVGGGPPLVEAAGAPPGTRVSVADLFFNTPARRKFLKKPATEAAAVADVVTRLFLSRPGVGFQLTHNGRRALSVPPEAPLKDRVALALGRETFDLLVPVDGGRGPVRVTGFCGAPDASAATSQKIQLFVNGRAVRDRSLQHAVARGYANLLPPGRYPVAVLFLSLPLDQVDVNVHPQKSEVRFADPRAVFEAVLYSVAGALRPAPWLGAGEDRASGGRAGCVSGPEPDGGSGVRREATTPEGNWASAALASEPAAVWLPEPSSAPPPVGLFATPTGYFSRLRYLGQVASTYLVCEGPEGSLVVLDQHAAHERVRFEDLRAQRKGRGLAAQRLLVPAVVELGPALAASVAAHRAELSALGFEVEDFGGGSFAVAAVPAPLTRVPLVPLLTDLAEQLAHAGATDAAEDAQNDALATLACHSAIRAGDSVDADQVAALLAALDRIDFKVRCPHGRPVVTTLTLADLERRVERR